jgi:histidine ammonia-lyase
VQEAVGSKADAAAADQLRSLLEGSKVAGTRKGTTPQQQQLFSSTPQVRGGGGRGRRADKT